MRYYIPLLTIMLLAAKLAAEVYAVKIGEDNFTYYSTPTKDGSAQKTAGNIYYRHAKETEANRVVATGLITVKLDEYADKAAFAQSNDLRLIEKIKSGTYLFKNISGTGDVELCAKLWEQEGVRFAVPLFQTRKRLQ